MQPVLPKRPIQDYEMNRWPGTVPSTYPSIRVYDLSTLRSVFREGWVSSWPKPNLDELWRPLYCVVPTAVCVEGGTVALCVAKPSRATNVALSRNIAVLLNDDRVPGSAK